MKKLLLLVACIAGISVMANAQTAGQSAGSGADSSFIYIYRGGQFGGALTNFSIWVDDKKLCKISNGKYFRVAVAPGTHKIEAKIGGVGVMKKETSVEVDVVAGKSNYISCNMKQSITRARLEMTEVVEKTGKKDIEKMSLDNCQGSIDDKD